MSTKNIDTTINIPRIEEKETNTDNSNSISNDKNIRDNSIYVNHIYIDIDGVILDDDGE